MAPSFPVSDVLMDQYHDMSEYIVFECNCWWKIIGNLEGILGRLEIHYGRSETFRMYTDNIRLGIQYIKDCEIRPTHIRVDKFDLAIHNVLYPERDQYERDIEHGIDLGDGHVMIINQNIAALNRTVIKSWDGHFYMVFRFSELAMRIKEVTKNIEKGLRHNYSDGINGAFCYFGTCSYDSEYGCPNPRQLIFSMLCAIGLFTEDWLVSSNEIDNCINSMLV